MMIRIFSIISICFSISFGDLAYDINQKIEDSGIPKSNISVSIKETGYFGKKIIDLNEYTSRVPASVMKVPTTLSALLQFGENFRWKTELYADGDIRDGVLYGNLIIKGGGDPDFKTEDVVNIVSKLKIMGLRSIKGNIVIDRNYFEPFEKSSAFFDNNPSNPYNAMPDAMMFNQNTTTLVIKCGDVYCEVDDKSFDIENNINTVNRSCRGRNAWPSSRIYYGGERPKVVLSGSLSKNCPPIKMTNIITKSYLACYNSFAEQFKNAGIDYQGRLVLSNTDVNARKIWTHYSKPLMQIIGETNKESNNLFARQIFLTVGAETLGSPSNLEKSRKAVRAILKNNGITDSDTLEIDNGSGLSRTARANTAVFEEILEKAYSKFGNRWLNALSIAGIDGTVKRRFPSSMRNMVWMKTGTVKNAKNIIGYVRSTNGTLYTVAILINDPRASSSGYKLENEIIKMLANVSSNDFSSSSFQASEERKTVSDGKYFVQVGSFSSSHTSYLESRLKNLQYDYKIITNGVNKKILVGPYSNKDEAQKNLSELKNKINSEAFIVTL